MARVVATSHWIETIVFGSLSHNVVRKLHDACAAKLKEQRSETEACALKPSRLGKRGAGLPEACNPVQHKAGRTCRCKPDIGNLKALKKQAPRVPKGCPFPRRKGPSPKQKGKKCRSH